jgi:hypothetical protein
MTYKTKEFENKLVEIAVWHLLRGAEAQLKDNIDVFTGRSFFTQKIMQRAHEVLNTTL